MRSIQLPDELCATAETKFGKRFAGVDELLTFVLRELVCDQSERMDDADRQMVEERLKALGYL